MVKWQETEMLSGAPKTPPPDRPAVQSPPKQTEPGRRPLPPSPPRPPPPDRRPPRGGAAGDGDGGRGRWRGSAEGADAAGPRGGGEEAGRPAPRLRLRARVPHVP